VDYSRFLGKTEELVLPYLGGPHVFGKDRRLRVDGERPALGFHRFEVRGRNARALGAAEAPVLDDLPRARGHLVEGWLVVDGGFERVGLLPEDEPPALAITRARRWHSGDFVFESLDFDGDVEEDARLRLERGEPLGDRGIPLTLRRAHGIALAFRASRQTGTPVSLREVAPHATGIADGGHDAARALLERLARERLEAAAQTRLRALQEEAARRVGRDDRAAPFPRARTTSRRAAGMGTDDAVRRAEGALDAAHAVLLATRSLAEGQLQVTFQFMGERFVTVVDALSLQVLDAGVCLDGEDRLVTLESLPGVLREAIDTDRLVITRR